VVANNEIKAEVRMRVKVEEVGKGLHPSEVVIQIQTAEGRPERLVVDKRSISNGTIEVGYPVRRDNGYFLIELPRETIGGSWRVWISKDIVVGGALEGAA
jgi:hypothetical protein